MATLSENIARNNAAWDLCKAALIEQGQDIPDGTPVEQYAIKVLDISGGEPRINFTLRTVDDFGENGNETVSIQADGGMIQYATTDADGVFQSNYVRTNTPYTFAVDEPPEALRGNIFSRPRKPLTTGTLPLPLDLTLEYIRTDLTDPQYVDFMGDIVGENAEKGYDLDVSTFGSVGSSAGKWLGGVLAPNGKIYGIPNNSTSVLEIDPETRTASTFGSVESGTGKWLGGVLAPNGKIYGIPNGSTTILEIDPETRTASTFGNLTGNPKWWGGVLAPNGKIYGIPFGSTAVLEIDPETRTTSTFGSVESGYPKWLGGVLAPNGKIYGIPHNPTAVLEIDPETRTTSTFGSVGSSATKWVGGVLAPNGKIYGIPFGSTAVLEINITGLTNFGPSALRSAYINKF